MKIKLNLIILLIMLLSFLGIYQSYEKKFIKPNIDKELREKVTKNYLTKNIKQAIQKGSIQEANLYKNLADFLNIKLDSTLIQTLQNKNSYLKTKLRDVKDFTNGFLSGKTSNPPSLVGSIVSDLTVVGDARDIYIQTNKIYKNQEYDKFTLGLSIVGVLFTASTLLSSGGTAPAKVGVSILKTAKKSGKLTESFSKILTRQLDKIIDFKKVDLRSLKSLKKAINQKELMKLERIFKELKSIKKETSTYDTIELLKYVKNENDLKKITKISQKYKKNTKGILKVLGKSALRGGKWVIDYSIKFLSFIVIFLVSLLWFIT